MVSKSAVDEFIKLIMQLKDLINDISELSKKKPNDAVNKFKLKFVNKLLDRSNSFLVDSYKPFEEFDLFSEDDLPTNSDVIMVLSQYLSCLKKYGLDNMIQNINNFQWYWVISGKVSNVEANREIVN